MTAAPEPPPNDAATCEDCGQPMVADDLDPMPGACFDCCLRRHDDLEAHMLDDILRAPTPDAALKTQYARLMDLGYRPAAASLLVRELADALGVPVPREALATADAAWERKVAAAGVRWGPGAAHHEDAR